jgi:DNA-binding transcriptional regulator YdaS (Cro superfamily)
MDRRKKLIQLAVEKAGSQKKLADAIGLSQQGVSWLLRNAPRVSAETALAIDRFTNGEIPKEKLRPDIFGVGR